MIILRTVRDDTTQKSGLIIVKIQIYSMTIYVTVHIYIYIYMYLL